MLTTEEKKKLYLKNLADYVIEELEQYGISPEYSTRQININSPIKHTLKLSFPVEALGEDAVLTKDDYHVFKAFGKDTLNNYLVNHPSLIPELWYHSALSYVDVWGDNTTDWEKSSTIILIFNVAPRWVE